MATIQQIKEQEERFNSAMAENERERADWRKSQDEWLNRLQSQAPAQKQSRVQFRDVALLALGIVVGSVLTVFCSSALN